MRLKKNIVGVNKDKEEVSKSTLEPDPDTFPVVKEFLEMSVHLGMLSMEEYKLLKV